jgi:hypothetical protein
MLAGLIDLFLLPLFVHFLLFNKLIFDLLSFLLTLVPYPFEIPLYL